MQRCKEIEIWGACHGVASPIVGHIGVTSGKKMAHQVTTIEAHK